MSIEVKIPAVGESITSGVLSAWHKRNGDLVSDGEALFTFETDKISTEVPASGSGRLEIRVDAGQEVQIGQVVALLDQNVAGSGGIPPGPSTTAPIFRDPDNPNVIWFQPSFGLASDAEQNFLSAAIQTGRD